MNVSINQTMINQTMTNMFSQTLALNFMPYLFLILIAGLTYEKSKNVLLSLEVFLFGGIVLNIFYGNLTMVLTLLSITLTAVFSYFLFKKEVRK
mgnify:CR=1 FL=1